ncbi:helix-turn-helix transcriptional regulator [Amycolatopsis sp.]|uniref:helix-turn-helix domain-containing protein n=1 Tax=Amycolatopsis sp. TaxID=37632 RepID=UPI002DFBB1C4|nr:helix-turn-helix transcriptional regulator [Amycolatopsis sp.]
MLKEKGTLPTLRSRELGDGLRAAMREAGMGVRELARRLDWTHPYLSHLLSGNRAVSELDLISIVVACHVKREERDRLFGLQGNLGTQGWLQQYGPGVVEQRTLVDNVRKATSLAEVQLAVVPRLLQTENYARAILGHASEREVRARLARQSIFNRSTQPKMTFFVHEIALRVVAGDAAVTSEQLHDLLRMSVRPSVELRIIPSAAGALAASFTVMEFADFTPIVCLEGEVSTVFLEQPYQVAFYQRILSVVAGSALDRRASHELTTSLAVELSAVPDGLPR